MLVKRQHMVTKEMNSMELDISEEQLTNWENGMLIQRAMPNLTPDEREFLMTGLLPGEYDEMFKEPEEDSNP